MRRSFGLAGCVTMVFSMFLIRFDVDGINCRIQEPSLFSTSEYSHRYKGPVLKNEVSISNYEGHSEHVNDPYRC